jgi:ankyrin repeat protein
VRSGAQHPARALALAVASCAAHWPPETALATATALRARFAPRASAMSVTNASLLAAARSGDLEAAQQACSSGISPIAAIVSEPDSPTPLHAACAAGNAEMVRLLLRACSGATQARDARGRTPLHSAAAAGALPCCSALLEHGADVAARQRGGATALHHAVSFGDASLVALLVRACPAVASAPGEREFTPLHLAARLGRADCAVALLDGGADVAACGGRLDGWTPLHVAAAVHAADVAALLLARGASVRAEDAFGDLPADKWAWGGPDADVVAGIAALSVRDPAKLAPLMAEATKPGFDHTAKDAPVELRIAAPIAEAMVLSALKRAECGDAAALSDMLDAGLCAAARDRREGERATPLLLAAAGSGHVAAATLLLARGADAGAANSAGVTPLHAAADAGLLDPMQLLIGAGAAVDARDVDGETPAYWAALAGRCDALRLLLDAGADVAAVTPTGVTLLDAAAEGGCAHCCALIAERGGVHGTGEKRAPPPALHNWLRSVACQPSAAHAALLGVVGGLREWRDVVCRSCL